MGSISIDNLADEIISCMEEYSEEVAEKTKIAVDRTTDEALWAVEANCTFEDRTGKYRRSLDKDTAFEDNFNKRNVVYAKGTQGHLSHLLENGHDIPYGGRTRAFPHFQYGEEYAEEFLEKNVIEELNK